ncbi:hypothetical protein BJ508DRAFT_308546 [Ascobolus immersus RN42]|uniref:MARVEL domain-containing protein n=1 Tax=Ascobolus immersus RN42 TaxID=1160509 RepID=A0A3N4HZK6_ASCIM|nr:hypothetical protein BJ508DRAFT_308546 [Ascobolus immersus RN42]
MRLPNFNARLMQTFSTVFHSLQAVFIPVIMGVVAAAMLQDGPAPSQEKFMFAMTWLFIPALIYIALTPQFERTKPLSHPYAIIALNSIYCFLWFVSFIALAVYNNNNQKNGFNKMKKEDREKNKIDKSSCATVENGTEKECGLNKTAVILGVFMFLWLFANTLIAAYVALYYRVHLITPLEASQSEGVQIQEQTKDAFSSSNEPDGYALIDGQHDDRMGGGSEYRGGSAYDVDEYNTYGDRIDNDGSYGRSGRVSAGSGSYENGRKGFPDGDYSYTGAGLR